MPPTTLFLIPVGFSLAFLLWVLWNLTKQLSSHDSTQTQPMISIQVSDRYTMRGLPERAETVPWPTRNHNSETGYRSGSARPYMRMPTASRVAVRTSVGGQKLLP